MASKQTQSKNLWSVAYSLDGVAEHSRLWILAATASSAANKALKVLRPGGGAHVEIRKVTWKGTIDAF